MSFDFVPKLPRWSWFAFCAAVGLAVAVLAYFLRAQVVVQDGPLLIEALILSDEAPQPWHHPFYIPIVWTIERLLGGEGLERRALEVASAVLGGLAVFAFGGAVRQFGRGLGESLGLLALFATSPGLIVHASIIEMHSGQLLGAATEAWFAALALTARSAPAAIALWFVAGSAAMGMHLLDSVLFAGGCMALFFAGCLAWRRDRRFWPAFRPVGLALIGLGLAAAGIEALSSQTVDTAAPGESGVEKATWLVEGFYDGPSLRVLWHEVLVPYLGVWFVLGLGLVRGGFAKDRRCLLFFTGLPLVTFVWMFGVPTAGGYALGALPFLALSTHLPRSRAGFDRFAIAAAVIGQVVLGHTVLRELDDDRVRQDFERRVALATELLPDGGVFLSGDIDWQPVSGRIPGLVEYTLTRELADARLRGLSPQEFVGLYIGGLPTFVENWGRIVVDPTWREQVQREPALGPYMQALEDAIALAPNARYVPSSAGEALLIEAQR